MFGGSSGAKQLDKQLFQLKYTSKQLNRLSVKCSKNEKIEKDKIKKALEKDNYDGARIHAQNAIREKNTAQNYLRLSSRVESVAQRLEAAIKMQQVTKSMGMVVKGMDKVLSSMNVEQISKVMDNFEKSFEDMDVRSEYVEQTMNSSTTMAMPEDQVDGLMQMVADEHGLKMKGNFGSADCASIPGSASSTGESAQSGQAAAAGGMSGTGVEDDLEERLRKLRN